MRYRALACDYDGTLARHGRVEDATLAALGLELQVVFNKGAVMVLPSGVSKATGLRAALAELDLSPRNVVGVGDAENDHAFLALCECGTRSPTRSRPCATAPTTSPGRRPAQASRSWPAPCSSRISRSSSLGSRATTCRSGRRRPASPSRSPATEPACWSPAPRAAARAPCLLERLAERGAQIVVIDPEGDYPGTRSAVRAA